MGPGIVGKTSYVIFGFLLLFGVVATKISSDAFLMWVAGISAGVVVFWLAISFWYADKYPAFAALESADVIRHMQLEQSAKDAGIIDLTASNTTNANAPESIKIPHTDPSG